MERFMAGLVKDFESGKIDRRQFCEAAALAATVFAAGSAAKAAPAKPEKKTDIDPFEDLLEKKKHAAGVHFDNELTVAQLKELVAEFKAAVKAAKK